MPGRRRPLLAVEASRRATEQLARLGGDVKTMRIRRSWTQGQLAERAGLGRMIVNRLERGVGPIDLDGLGRLGIAFGVPLSVSFARDPKLEVADDLAIQELVLRIGRAQGQVGGFELATRPAEPWRSIDVVLRSDEAHRMICVECWNTIGDIGAAARASARKAAELEQVAVGLWGADARVGLVWIVRSTRRNRDLLATYPETFAARFPGSSRDWVAALTEGREPPKEPGLVWCDLGATRLFEWRRGMATST